MNKLKKVIVNQRGNVLVFVALSMFMIIGFIALVIDGGSLFYTKSNLQKGLDAAVLAGAQELKNGEADAIKAAIEVANKNNIALIAGDFGTGADYIEVTKSVPQDFTFAKVLGISPSNVAAYAKAQLVTLTKKTGVVPIGFPKPDSGFVKDKIYVMNFQPKGLTGGYSPEVIAIGSSIRGNFGFLDLDDKGKGEGKDKEDKDKKEEDTENKNLRDTIINGSNKEIGIYEMVDTKSGLTWGQAKQGFQDRIDKDTTNSDCSIYDKADDTCSRVFVIPIVESYEQSKSQTKVIGFASFWLHSIDGHGILGRFKEIVTFGTSDDGITAPDYGVYGVRLVQ